MNLLVFMAVAAVVGMLAWAITTYLPMPQPVKNVIIFAAVVGLLLWLLSALLNGNHLYFRVP